MSNIVTLWPMMVSYKREPPQTKKKKKINGVNEAFVDGGKQWGTTREGEESPWKREDD